MTLADLFTVGTALAAFVLSGYSLFRQSRLERRQRATVSGRVVARLFRLGNSLLEHTRWLEALELRRETSTPYTVAIARRILEELDLLDVELRRLSDDAASADPIVMAYMDVALNGVADAKTYSRSIIAEPPDEAAIPGYRHQLHDRLTKSANALMSAHTQLLNTDSDLDQDQRNYHRLVGEATIDVLSKAPSSGHVVRRKR